MCLGLLLRVLRSIDTSDVIKRVKDLFQGHDNLILGFNTFVPKVRWPCDPATLRGVRTSSLSLRTKKASQWR